MILAKTPKKGLISPEIPAFQAVSWLTRKKRVKKRTDQEMSPYPSLCPCFQEDLWPGNLWKNRAFLKFLLGRNIFPRGLPEKEYPRKSSSLKGISGIQPAKQAEIARSRYWQL